MSNRRYKNLLIEVYKLNLHKILFQSILALKLRSKYIGLLRFFFFKQFVFPSDVKRSESFSGFTPWTSTKAPLWIDCGACSTLKPHLHFTTFKKSILLQNMNTSKTAWINPWGDPPPPTHTHTHTHTHQPKICPCTIKKNPLSPNFYPPLHQKFIVNITTQLLWRLWLFPLTKLDISKVG